MRYGARILLAVVLSIVVASCSKNRMSPVTINSALSENNFEIPPTGGSFSIVCTADKEWSVTQIPAWMNVDNPHGGEGTTVLRFMAECNQTRVDRVSDIVISADDGSFSRKIVASQTYPYLRLASSGDIEKEFDYNEDSCSGSIPFEIPIESNVDWIVREKTGSSDLSRFKVSAFKGEHDDTLEILPRGHNFGTSPYTALCEIVPVMRDPDTGAEDAFIDIPDEAADSYTVYLSQDNFLFLLNGSPDEFQVKFSELDNMESSVDVTVESECPWAVADAPDWVRMNYDAGQMLTLSISPDGVNPMSEVRSGVIVLRADAEEPVEREINVSQNGYLFELSGFQELSFACDDTTRHIVTLSTTGGWEILDVPDWLEMDPVSCLQTTPESGITDHEISVRMKDENLDFEPRISEIVFSRIEKPYNVSEDPLDIKQAVVHDAFMFDLEPSPVLSRIPTFNTLAYPVVVRCSGGWEIESLSDWVSVSEMSGEKGENTLMVSALTANPDLESDRIASVEFVSLRHKALGIDARRTLEITQRQYVFEISAPELEEIPAYKTEFPGYAANLQCSAEWELLEWPDWLTPDIVSGDGMEDVDIMFTPNNNTSLSPRSGVVRLKDVYMEKEISVTAVQDAFVFDASDRVFRDIPVMNDVSYQVQFDMTAEAPWKLTSYPSWIMPAVTEGHASASGTVLVSFLPEPNPEERQRTGVIILESTVSGTDKRIEFIQNPYEFDDSRVDLHFTELSDISERIEVECSGPWTVDAPSWVIVNPSRGTGSQNVYVSVDHNTVLQSREASFTLLSTLNGLTREINIEQDPYEFDMSAESFEFTALDNEKVEFDVLCSGSWKAERVPSWVSLVASDYGGSEDGETEAVSLSVSDNLTESNREAVIVVRSEDNRSLVKNISVSQERFVMDVSVSSCEFRANDKKSVSVSVTCSDDWTVSAADSWVNVTGITGLGFRISVDENRQETERSSTVIVKNARSGISKAIRVVQEGVE
ncbi:MAG TPA: hypothetical protein IAC03_03410 [Candidatus Coprenecus pullistercoris]|nr:hypothetical protein [Candidatus Coprenecus pullistercoris]